MRQWPIIFILRPPARTSNMWLFLSAAAIHYLCHKKNEFFSPHSTLVGFLFHGEIAYNCFCYASYHFLKRLFVSHSFGKGCVTSNSETKGLMNKKVKKLEALLCSSGFYNHKKWPLYNKWSFYDSHWSVATLKLTSTARPLYYLINY